MKQDKNFRSRYDENRGCYRKDKTHYVYREWIESEDGSGGHYADHVLTAGEDGVTPELLEFLQETDNAEVQDREDDDRHREEIEFSITSYYETGPEEELLSDEEVESVRVEIFNRLVRPHLSEEQMDLIYDRYGMGKTLKQIAEESPLKPDGKHVTHQSVNNRLNKILKKVEKYMPEE